MVLLDRFEMELHMVHMTEDPNAEYKIAVVGLLYRFGSPNAFLAKVKTTLNHQSYFWHDSSTWIYMHNGSFLTADEPHKTYG